jgi:hypothetical protein
LSAAEAGLWPDDEMNRLFVALAVSTVSAAVCAAADIVQTEEFIRSAGGPEGLSGLTLDRKGRWWSVDDRGGMLYECRIGFGQDGSVVKFDHVTSVKLEGCTDIEDCAADPLRENVIYVSDEKTSEISAHDVVTGRRIETVAMPGDFSRNVRKNRSLESLAISPDGLTMWTANEDTLVNDGKCADAKSGGKVRIMRFVRKAAGKPWQFAGWNFYVTDPAGGKPYKGMIHSGLVALADRGDGTLLALEREMSLKNPLFPSFRGRIYEIRPSSVDGAKVDKRRLWGDDTFIFNYEAMALTPADADGVRRLVTVSDGGGSAGEAVSAFLLKPARTASGK